MATVSSELLRSYFTRKLSPLCDDSDVVDLLYPDQLKQLTEMLRRCVVLSESNSLLLMGPRGVGKSVLVRTALRRLANMKEANGNYSVVELFGTVHLDDRSALKDITRQLQLENVVEDRVFGSFAENLQFLLDSLRSDNADDRSKAKSSIFILDDFELFTQHKNQTLLYNLFDVAQSRQAPIVVVGLCCRLDAVELLEKRVKSRFAHRFLYLMNAVSEAEFASVAETLLSIGDAAAFGGDRRFAAKWNKQLQKAVLPEMADSLAKLYHVDRIVRTLVRCLQPMVRQIVATPPLGGSRGGGSGDEDHVRPLRTSLFRDAVNRIYEVDPKQVVASKMPSLHVVLLVCMLRLNAIYDGEPFNFELVYKEFVRVLQATKSLLDVSKAIAFKAFESICELEFVQAVGGATGSSQTRYRLHHLHFSADTVRRAVQDNGGLPVDVAQWVTTTLSDRALGI